MLRKTVIALFGIYAFVSVVVSLVEAHSGDKACVHVYRYNHLWGIALHLPVFCDNDEVAHITNGSRFVLLLEPGRHLIRSDDKQAEISLDAKPGETYYVRVAVVSGKVKGHGQTVMVPGDQGEHDIQHIKWLNHNQVKNYGPVRLESVPVASQPAGQAQTDPGPRDGVNASSSSVPTATGTKTDSDSSKVSVDSSPQGADIEIDGKFVGNTPTELELKAGRYHFRILKTGLPPWERDLEVLPGALVHLRAEFESNLGQAQQVPAANPPPTTPAAAAKLSLEIQDVEVKPATVAPDEQFDLDVSYMAVSQIAGGAKIQVRFSYGIDSGGKRLYESEPVPEESEIGRPAHVVRRLTAANTPGQYTFRIRLELGNITAQRDVVLTVAQR